MKHIDKEKVKTIKLFFELVLWTMPSNIIFYGIPHCLLVCSVILLAIIAIGFAAYGFSEEKKIIKAIPRICLLYIFFFVVINIYVSKNILLYAKTFVYENGNEIPTKLSVVLSILKFSSYLIFCGFLFFVIQRAKKFFKNKIKFLRESKESDNKIEYWNYMKGIVAFVSGTSKLSFLLTLISLFGSVLILYYKNAVTTELFEKMVNHAVFNGYIFPFILFIGIVGILAYGGKFTKNKFCTLIL